jgi:hypothetical protein
MAWASAWPRRRRSKGIDHYRPAQGNSTIKTRILCLNIVKSKNEIDGGLREMKEQVSPALQAVLSVVGKWVCGPAEIKDCVRALRGIEVRFGTAGRRDAKDGKEKASS